MPETDAAPGAPADSTSTTEGQEPTVTTTVTEGTTTHTAPPEDGLKATSRETEAQKKVAEQVGDKKADAKATDTKSESAPKADAKSIDELPDWAQKIVKDARKGEGDYRVAAKTAQEQAADAAKQHKSLIEGLAKVLGLTEDDEGEDLTKLGPEKLAEIISTKDSELSARDQRISALMVERAAEKTARKLGADGDRMTDSRSFVSKLEKLDMSADDFDTKLTELVKKTLADHPEYKLAAPAAAAPSGGEFTGGPGGKRDAESMSVDDFRKQRASRST